MTVHDQPSPGQPAGFRDAAAGGIFPGLLGGVVMALVLIAGGLLYGAAPAQVMGSFDSSVAAGGATSDGLPLRGALNHLAVSCVYGSLFAVFTRALAAFLRSPARVVVWGLVYGLLLWLVAVTLLRQAAASLLTVNAPEVFLLAHLAYGLTLGLAARRQVTGSALKPVEITGQRR